ncbi:hypothetical protein TRVA0_002S04214 [Trichomonascus vanleenenianus]|uniref:uncharacterized protein n=1 Tax=Trichomonascus vanleenenianus TaxID=2268995 RepID=UPI003ECA8422
MVWGCIERIVWRFLSPPPSSMNNSALHFMISIFSTEVQSVELDIPDQGGHFLIFMMRLVLEDLTDLAQMKLTLRQGDFSSTGFAYQVLKTFDYQGNWHNYAELHIEVSNIEAAGCKELERLSPWISSITVDRLVDKDTSDHLIWLIGHTRKDFKIYVNKFEIPGETAIHLSRGNLSLTIGSISSKSMLMLTCDEQLTSLTLTESVAERLVGQQLNVGELQVRGQPNAASVQRITTQFTALSIATTHS